MDIAGRLGFKHSNTKKRKSDKHKSELTVRIETFNQYGKHRLEFQCH